MIKGERAIQRRIKAMHDIGWPVDRDAPVESYRECLSSLYIISGLTQNCIGQVLDMIPETVRQDLDKLEIPTRSRDRKPWRVPGRIKHPEDMDRKERRQYLLDRAMQAGIYTPPVKNPERLALYARATDPYEDDVPAQGWSLCPHGKQEE